jgi:hypothetical protein
VTAAELTAALRWASGFGIKLAHSPRPPAQKPQTLPDRGSGEEGLERPRRDGLVRTPAAQELMDAWANRVPPEMVSGWEGSE